jgi:hypothetical protein
VRRVHLFIRHLEFTMSPSSPALVSLRNIFRLAIWSQLVVLPAMAAEHADVQCEKVLIPTVESVRSDYALLQTFAKVNASALYDEIKKTEGSSAGGGGRFAGFGVDFQQSKNAEEFKKLVEKRLESENFTMSESDAKSYYRRGISDTQVQAWLQCTNGISDGGAVLLTARNVDASGFHLVITWIPQKGIGSAPLELVTSGGTILGKSEYRENMTGRGAKTFLVVAGSRAPVKVLANIGGSTDSVMVTQAKNWKPPPVVCLPHNEVRRYSADDNFVNAPLNRSPCFVHNAFTGTNPDIDSWYRILVPIEGHLKITLAGISAQFALQLRDGKGQVVKLPAPAIGSDRQIIEAAVSPGEYFIRPQPYSGPSMYDLDVSFTPKR